MYKTITISAKCSDLCFTEIKDEKDIVIAENNGYVPDFFPEKHYGDYVMFDIDVETGKILNWKVTQKQIDSQIADWNKKKNKPLFAPAVDWGKETNGW